MRRLLASLALCGLLAAGPAAAAVTVTELGTGTASTGASNIIVTLTADVAVGDVIVVNASNTNGVGSNSLLDSVGGATGWNQPYTGTDGVNLRQKIWYKVVTSAITGCPGACGTVTVGFSNTSGAKHASIAKISGLAASPYDQANFTSSAGVNATSNTATTGTLAQAESVVVAGVLKSGNGTIAFNNGFTPLTEVVSTGASRLGYKVVSSTSAVSYTASTGNSVAWITGYAVFKCNGACAGSVRKSGMLWSK